jgi:hypothetical protein
MLMAQVRVLFSHAALAQGRADGECSRTGTIMILQTHSYVKEHV